MAVRQNVTIADAALCAYVQSLELAAAAAYDRVLTQLPESTAPIATAFQAHHREWAARLGALATSAAAKGPNPGYSAVLSARLQAVSDERTALTFAFGFENQLTATYEFCLTSITSRDVIMTISTIVPVVAGHCAVLGSITAIPPSLLFPNGPFEATTVGDGSDLRIGIDPALFPVA